MNWGKDDAEQGLSSHLGALITSDICTFLGKYFLLKGFLFISSHTQYCSQVNNTTLKIS